MHASLHALVSDIVDYAGMFPPANLDLGAAIRNYARYGHEPEAWMLGRLICPASRLGELQPYVEGLFNAGPVLRLSILARGGQTCEQFLEGVQSDLKDMAEFCARTDERTSIEAFEARLPGGLSNEDEVLGLLGTVSDLWSAQRMGRVPTFYEPPPETDRRSTWAAIIRGIAQHEVASGGTGDAQNTLKRVGFKLRCGGTDASSYPSVEQVASAIWGAHTAQVPMKFTAGLHQPLRHHNDKAQADTHGFLNVFAAGVLATSDNVNQEHVRDILASEDAESFDFKPEAMSWKGIEISRDAIAKARRQAVTSFGSCSFDDPREGLRALGLVLRR